MLCWRCHLNFKLSTCWVRIIHELDKNNCSVHLLAKILGRCSNGTYQRREKKNPIEKKLFQDNKTNKSNRFPKSMNYVPLAIRSLVERNLKLCKIKATSGTANGREAANHVICLRREVISYIYFSLIISLSMGFFPLTFIASGLCVSDSFRQKQPFHCKITLGTDGYRTKVTSELAFCALNKAMHTHTKSICHRKMCFTSNTPKNLFLRFQPNRAFSTRPWLTYSIEH